MNDREAAEILYETSRLLFARSSLSGLLSQQCVTVSLPTVDLTAEIKALIESIKKQEARVAGEMVGDS